MLKKKGPKKFKELEKLVFQLNFMLRESRAGAPADHFLGRNVKSLLPNSVSKVLSLMREIEKRRQEQQMWMKRLGRGSAEAFEVGDKVRVQDTHSG